MWIYILSLIEDLINGNALEFLISHLASESTYVGLFGLTLPSHTSFKSSF